MLDTRAAMGDKPVIVCLRMHNPTVLSELEPAADAILIDFGVQKQVLLDLICGKAEPSALLPVELPASMETVEAHCEDKPFDYEVYVDSEGHGLWLCLRTELAGCHQGRTHPSLPQALTHIKTPAPVGLVFFAALI